jgi:hypothetical protein
LTGWRVLRVEPGQRPNRADEIGASRRCKSVLIPANPVIPGKSIHEATIVELLSILVITYVASGEPIQTEMVLQHSQCMAAQASITAAILGPQDARPSVEMLNGKFAPMIAATCLPACIPDALGLEPLELLAALEDA